MAQESLNKTSWYQTWWGVLLLGIGILILLALIGLGGLVGFYWWQIKSGKGGEIAQKLGNPTSATTTAAINPTRKELETADDPFLGNPDAGLVVVEFVDFKCPNSRAADPIIRKLTQKYWKKVKVIVRDFPAESVHQGASELALLASCASEQGKYWTMSDLFFQNQDQLTAGLSEEQVKQISDQAGVDFEKLKTCLANPKVRTEINKDYSDGFKYGVRGTPTFFLNGNKVEGVISWDAWDKFMQNF